MKNTMKRYYSKTTMNEVFEPSTDTIENGSGVIDWWFSPLSAGENIIYDNGMPYKFTEDFKKPVVVGGVVVEGQTQAEADTVHKQSEKARIQEEMNALLGGMTPSESMLLMLKYGFEKMNAQSGDSNDSPTPSVPLTPTGEDLVTWGDRVASELEAKMVELRSL
jgi:hypothetical protein